MSRTEPMISKELAKKIKKLIKCNEEAQQLMREIKQEMCEKDEDCAYMYDPFVTEEPCGDDQGDGEFCDQWTGYCEDDYHGIYYYPLPQKKKAWVGFHYDM